MSVAHNPTEAPEVLQVLFGVWTRVGPWPGRYVLDPPWVGALGGCTWTCTNLSAGSIYSATLFATGQHSAEMRPRAASTVAACCVVCSGEAPVRRSVSDVRDRSYWPCCWWRR